MKLIIKYICFYGIHAIEAREYMMRRPTLDMGVS